MGNQSNPQLKLKFGDLVNGEFQMNGVKVTYHDFSDGFINFLTNPNVNYGEIDEDENKIKRFSLDIRYDIGKVIREAVDIKQYNLY